jgi:hypothetical protein
LLTTAKLLLIFAVGWIRGFSTLKRVEQVLVGVKLPIIAGLLLGLGIPFGGRAGAGDPAVGMPARTGWHGLAFLAGLGVTVQGFETSRYLGRVYHAARRIRSMRLARMVASAI